MEGKRARTNWPEKLPQIQSMAGRVPMKEMASRLGVTAAALQMYCSKAGISLRVAPEFRPSRAPKSASSSERNDDGRMWKARAEELALLINKLFDLGLECNPDPTIQVRAWLRMKLKD